MRSIKLDLVEIKISSESAVSMEQYARKLKYWEGLNFTNSSTVQITKKKISERICRLLNIFGLLCDGQTCAAAQGSNWVRNNEKQQLPLGYLGCCGAVRKRGTNLTMHHQVTIVLIFYRPCAATAGCLLICCFIYCPFRRSVGRSSTVRDFISTKKQTANCER